MRFVDYEHYVQAKKQLDLRMALFASILTGILLFLLGLGGGAGLAFGLGIGGFIILFLLVYGLLRLTEAGADRKRRKIDINLPYLDVTFQGELGILILADDAIVFKALNAMATNKEVVLDINEDLFVSFGEFRRKALDKYRYGELEKCHITVRPMPHGVVRTFVFFNIDNCIESVERRLNEISRFNSAKYQ